MQKYNEIKIPVKKRNFKTPILSEEEIKSILQKSPAELEDYDRFLKNKIIKNQKLWISVTTSFLKFNSYCQAFIYQEISKHKQILKKEQLANQKLIEKLTPSAALIDHFKNLDSRYHEDFEEYFKNELNEDCRKELVRYLQNYQLNKAIEVPIFYKKSVRTPKFFDYFKEISKDQQNILIHFISDPIAPFQQKITRDIYGQDLRISTIVKNACIAFNNSQIKRTP